MRILAVGNMYPPHHLGGYELVWRAAMCAAREQGHEVRVLTTDFRREEVNEASDPFVRRTLRWYWRDHEWPQMSPLERLHLERHNARAFTRELREFRPDVVSWWAMGGMSLSLIARAGALPAAAFVHDDWLVYGPEVDAWMRMFASRRRAAALVRRLTGMPTTVELGQVRAWLFVSDATRRRAFDGGAPVPRERTEIAHSGIEAAFLDRRPERPWAWRLLYAGRIDSRKGIDTAIDALAKLPAEATLAVIGSGDERELSALRDRVRRLGLPQRVEFMGPRTRSELPGLYAAADAIVFPVRWDEPWGLIPLEAMGIGRPVVATGRGGSGEYLRHGENCLLFEAGDAAALAAAIERLAGDAALRARLREGGFATAAVHTEEAFNAGVLEALERVRRG